MNKANSFNSELENGSGGWKPWTSKEFIATMLHELRTPMTVIKGYVEIHSNEKQREHHPEAIKAIAGSIGRMEKLHKDMMAYARQLMQKPDT